MREHHYLLGTVQERTRSPVHLEVMYTSIRKSISTPVNARCVVHVQFNLRGMLNRYAQELRNKLTKRRYGGHTHTPSPPIWGCLNITIL